MRRDARPHLGRVAVRRLLAAQDDAAVSDLPERLGQGVARGPGVASREGPVVAPLGTAALICVSDTTLNSALTPLNRTELAPLKSSPSISTVVPGRPAFGVKLTTMGFPVWTRK